MSPQKLDQESLLKQYIIVLYFILDTTVIM